MGQDFRNALGRSHRGGQYWRLQALGVCGIAAIVVSAPAPAYAAELTQWTFDPTANRLEITVSASITPSHLLLPQPTRIVLDLPDTQMGAVAMQQVFTTGAVRRIRVSQYQPNVTRLVLELSPDVELDPKQVALEPIGGTGQKAQQWSLRPLLANQANRQPTPASTPTSGLPPAATSQLPAIEIDVPTPDQSSPPSPASAPVVTPVAIPPSPTPAVARPTVTASPSRLPTLSEALPPALPPVRAQVTVVVPPPGPIRAATIPPVPSPRIQGSPPASPSVAPLPPASLPVSPSLITPTTSQPPSRPTPMPPPVTASPGRNGGTIAFGTPLSATPTGTVSRSAIPLPPQGANTPTPPPIVTFGTPPPVTPATSQPIPLPPTSIPAPPNRLPGTLGATPRGAIAGVIYTAVSTDASRTGVVLPAGTILSLRYPGTTALNLQAAASRQDILLLQTEIRDTSGQVLLPAGTPVIGQFQVTNQGGRFVAAAIALADRNIALSGQSDLLLNPIVQPNQTLQITLTTALTRL